MKTRLIILTAAAAMLLYSCSNDRDEEVRKDAIEAVKNSKPENLKLNPKGLSARGGDLESKSDTIVVKALNSGPQDPIDLTDPVDGGDPTTITPPKR
ncbi:hypothetical protein [Chryseobacterium sp. JK1]|uniref:hypothetical protein n=1 Tax=Chryseobacterium sp. JK1 TaxID=874294 RepID=UPI003D683FFE